jgi:hypothetical protein
MNVTKTLLGSIACGVVALELFVWLAAVIEAVRRNRAVLL